MVVRTLLDFDQVRHRGDLGHTPEAFPHKRSNHSGHIGGVHTDPVRFVESTVLNTESKTHAPNEKFTVGPVY